MVHFGLLVLVLYFFETYKGQTDDTPATCQPDIFYAFLEEFGDTMLRHTILCQLSLRQLRLNLAGRHGPVQTDHIWDMMCSDDCLASDELHAEALTSSGCDCLELSVLGTNTMSDFCLENSARLMCTELDRCGQWECRIGDFNCPRHEFNKMFIPNRGLGDCSAGVSWGHVDVRTWLTSSWWLPLLFMFSNVLIWNQ